MPLGHSRGIFALIVLAGLIASAHVTAAAKPAKPIKVDDVEEKKEIDMSEWFANGLKNNPEAATEALKEKMAGDEALAQAFMAIGQVANRQEKGEAAKLTGSEELVMPKEDSFYEGHGIDCRSCDALVERTYEAFYGHQRKSMVKQMSEAANTPEKMAEAIANDGKTPFQINIPIDGFVAKACVGFKEELADSAIRDACETALARKFEGPIYPPEFVTGIFQGADEGYVFNRKKWFCETKLKTCPSFDFWATAEPGTCYSCVAVLRDTQRQMERETEQDGFGSKRHIGMSIENTCGLLPLRHPKRANIGKMKAWCEDFLEEFDGTVISEFNRNGGDFRLTTKNVCVKKTESCDESSFDALWSASEPFFGALKQHKPVAQRPKAKPPKDASDGRLRTAQPTPTRIETPTKTAKKPPKHAPPTPTDKYDASKDADVERLLKRRRADDDELDGDDGLDEDDATKPGAAAQAASAAAAAAEAKPKEPAPPTPTGEFDVKEEKKRVAKSKAEKEAAARLNADDEDDSDLLQTGGRGIDPDDDDDDGGRTRKLARDLPPVRDLPRIIQEDRVPPPRGQKAPPTPTSAEDASDHSRNRGGKKPQAKPGKKKNDDDEFGEIEEEEELQLEDDDTIVNDDAGDNLEEFGDAVEGTDGGVRGEAQGVSTRKNDEL